MCGQMKLRSEGALRVTGRKRDQEIDARASQLPPTRVWIGIQVQALNKALALTLGLRRPKGAIVTDVFAGAPADDAGLLPGDVVLALGGQDLESESPSGDSASLVLSRRAALHAPGEKLRLELLRKGRRRTISVTLQTSPWHGFTSTCGMTLQCGFPGFSEGRDRNSGAVVVDLDSPGAGESAGVLRGDVIVDVNGRAVANPEQVVRELRRRRKAGLVRVRVRRNGVHRFVVLDVSA